MKNQSFKKTVSLLLAILLMGGLLPVGAFGEEGEPAKDEPIKIAAADLLKEDEENPGALSLSADSRWYWKLPAFSKDEGDELKLEIADVKAAVPVEGEEPKVIKTAVVKSVEMEGEDGQTLTFAALRIVAAEAGEATVKLTYVPLDDSGVKGEQVTKELKISVTAAEAAEKPADGEELTEPEEDKNLTETEQGEEPEGTDPNAAPEGADPNAEPEEAVVYKITFTAGDHGTFDPIVKEVAAGEVIVAPADEELTADGKFAVDCWVLEQEEGAEEETYLAEDTVAAADAVYVAQWLPTYTVVFDPGEDATTDIIVKENVKAGSEIQAPTARDARRDGFRPTGWILEGSEEEPVVVKLGNMITVTGDATYLAQWQETTTGPVTAATNVTLYINEVARTQDLSNYDTKSKTEPTITVSDSTIVKAYVNKAFTGNESAKAVLCLTAGERTTSSPVNVKVTYPSTKGGTTTSEYNVTVSVPTPPEGYPPTSTVQFRIVNGTWNKNASGLPYSNLSEDGTTITFITYTSKIVDNQPEGGYIFNCSKTHDGDQNNSNCISLESCLLALLGDSAASFVTPKDSSYSVDFQHQDWTIDSGNAIDYAGAAMFNGGVETGRSQMQAVQASVHSFDDNSRSKDTDSYAFQPNTVYTLTLLQAPYSNKTASYTVEYREGSATGTKLLKDKQVDGKQLNTNYTELAESIPGYVPNVPSQDVKLTVEDENKIIQFIYTPVKPHLTIEKTGEVKDSAGAVKEKAEVGDTINYTIKVTNDGQYEIKNINLLDSLTKGTGTVIARPGENWTGISLQPGESTELHATYTVLDSDVAAGSIVNTATIAADTATYGDDNKPFQPTPENVTPGEDTKETGELPDPELTVTKTEVEGTTIPAALGQKVKYTVTVKNTGNVTLTNVVVKDEKTDDTFTVDSLPAGETKTFTTKEYTITEADILAGKAVNTLTYTAKDPKDNEIKNPEDKPPMKETPTVPLDKTIETTKTIKTVNGEAPAEGYIAAAGDSVVYEVTVENKGNTTVSNITVTDTLPNGKTLTKTIDSIAPGKSASVEFTYIVEEDDLFRGTVKNTALASGTGIDGEETSSEGKIETPADKVNTSIDVDVKETSKPSWNETYLPGEKITYDYTVTNTGNVTLHDVKVVDSVTKEITEIPELKPGESVIIPVEYKVKNGDARDGKVINNVTATGENKNGTPVTDNASVTSRAGFKNNKAAPYTGDDDNMRLSIIILLVSATIASGCGTVLKGKKRS